jgi:hypothetical protein
MWFWPKYIKKHFYKKATYKWIWPLGYPSSAAKQTTLQKTGHTTMHANALAT